MALKTLDDAFLNELRDLLGAEKKIAKALPRMAKKARNSELKQAFEEHQKQTEEQVSRLEHVFEMLEQKPRAKKCEGMEGILEEGKELMGEDADPEVLDPILIAAAQKVEHYEIAAYGTICTWAEQLDCDREIINLLKQTLSEEKETDQQLTKLAEQRINKQAVAT